MNFIRRRLKKALIPLAGAALVVACASPASAIIEAKGVLGWGIWGQEGITGSTVTIANVEGNLANWNHVAIRQRVMLNLVWPFEPRGTVQDTIDRTGLSNHATATASALVGKADSSITAIEGVAPKSNVINTAFATGVDPTGAFIVDLTALSFVLFATTDQALADQVADALNIERYPAATVVNISSTRRLQEAHQTNVTGEDAFSRTVDAAAFTTGALFITPAGDLGNVMELEMEDRGTMAPPGSGFNTLSVGFADASLQPHEDTSQGPQVASDWRVLLNLTDPMAQPPIGGDQEDFPNSPDAMDEVEDARPGPDIIAPGENIRLAGSIASSPESTNSFSSFWTGSSVSCAIVAGAAALVQDAGNKRGMWNGDGPSALVTKAVLINSANKDGFNNMGMTGQGPAPPFQPNDESEIWITEQALDPMVGGGLLDFNRLWNQFVLAKVPDYRNIEGFTIDPETLQYTVPTEGPEPGVPFVSVQNPLSNFEGPDFGTDDDDDGPGGPGGPGGNLSADLYEAGGDPLLLEILDQPITFRDVYNAQLGGPSPDLDGTGGVGVDVPDRPIWNPRFPVGRPVIPPNCPQCPQFRTGWDEGNLGFGYIDFPIGFVTPGSSITATLCWNRHLKWSVPDFAGPLNFIDPQLATPGADDLGISLDSANFRAAADPIDRVRPDGSPAPMALREEARIRRALNPRQAPILGERDRMHVVTDDGLCNDVHAVANHDHLRGAHDPQGDLRERLEDIFDAQRAREDKVQVGANPLRGSGGFDIVYNLAPDVAANDDFVAALNTAAAVWEDIISDPVIIFVDVGFTSDQGFIAATLSVELGYPYGQVRSALNTDANFAERRVMEALPSNMQWNTSAGPVSAGTIMGIGIPRANAKGLGLSVGNPANTDSLIVFNTDFTYDNDPTDGQVTGDIDTVAVMAHEIGHMLGFVSDAEATAFNGFAFPSVLDMFRFPITQGEDPNSLQDFTDFRREITVGVEAALDTADGISGIGQEFRFSTGSIFPGDGRQASHWIDDIRTGQLEYVGIMDPTYSAPEGPGEGIPEAPEGEIPEYLTGADLLAFSLIGWDIEFDTDLPPSMLVPDVGLEPLPGFVSTVPEPEIEWAFDNLDLQLFREGDGGGGSNIPVAYSRTLWNNVELFYVGGNGAGGGEDQIPAGNYFIRVIHINTRYDMGGTVSFDFPTIPVDGYANVPQAQIDYGLAWYIDLARTNEEFITEDLKRKSDLNGDGVINGSDLSVLIAAFGKSHPTADIDGDGVVNSSDLATIVSFFGQEL